MKVIVYTILITICVYGITDASPQSRVRKRVERQVTDWPSFPTFPASWTPAWTLPPATWNTRETNWNTWKEWSTDWNTWNHWNADWNTWNNWNTDWNTWAEWSSSSYHSVSSVVIGVGVAVPLIIIIVIVSVSVGCVVAQRRRARNRRNTAAFAMSNPSLVVPPPQSNINAPPGSYPQAPPGSYPTGSYPQAAAGSYPQPPPGPYPQTAGYPNQTPAYPAYPGQFGAYPNTAISAAQAPPPYEVAKDINMFPPTENKPEDVQGGVSNPTYEPLQHGNTDNGNKTTETT